MSVELLLVEGQLEFQIFTKVFNGLPAIERGGSKNALAPETRRRREQAGRANSYYIRDRDFDFYPPNDISLPTIDKADDKGVVLGWRWCRHEIENYLIDPLIVSRVADCEVSVVEEHVAEAAKRIRAYEVARWVIGAARHQLPPHYKLATRPAEAGDDIGLPADLSDSGCWGWCESAIREYRQRIDDALGESAVEDNFKDFRLTFSDESRIIFTGDAPETAANALLWCSGKDLLAAMSDWLKTLGFKNPGEYRAAARDWVIDNTDEALGLIPEWKKFREIVRHGSGSGHELSRRAQSDQQRG